MDTDIDKPQRNGDELRHALENVTRQLLEVTAAKKQANKEYNERLADLKAERDAIMEQLSV